MGFLDKIFGSYSERELKKVTAEYERACSAGEVLNRAQTKKKADAMAKANATDFAPGDRVSHPKFGEGTVLELNGNVIRIEFADQTRKLALGIAPLKKL